MRILHIAGSTNIIGGIEKYNNDLFTSIMQKKIDIKLIEREKGGLLKKINFSLKFLYHLFYFNPNFIICSHINFGILCLIAKFLKKTNFSLSLYGIEIPKRKTFFSNLLISSAFKIITISYFSKKLILENFDIPDKIFFLPSHINEDKYKIKPINNKILEKYNLRNKKIILSLSRLSSNEFKGQDRVALSLKEVLKKEQNIVYVIAGPGRDERLNKILSENPQINNKIVRIASVTEYEKIDLYNLSDIFILPSKFEGFGIVFIESLACGLKVIASDGYGCREGLLNGDIGTLIDPDSTKDIAKAIIKELNIPNTKESRIELRNKAIEIYGKKNWNRRIDNLIITILKKS